MYRAIVVGTDNSDRAGAAVEHAAELAKATGAHLHIVTAVLAPAAISAAHESVGAAAYQQSADAVLTAQQKNIDSVAKRIEAEGVPTTTHVHWGDPISTLHMVAAEVGGDLIVVGNKGLSGVRRLFGSIPGSVARKSNVAVLIVHTG